MTLPEYEYASWLIFGGVRQDERAYARASAVIFPVPLERTTSYVAGTRTGPREILLASGQMELWDEETSTSASSLALCTLPEMEFPFPTMEAALQAIGSVAGQALDDGKFLVALGGEHSVTVPLVEAAASRHPGLSVLQIDAHADLRPSYMGNRFSHASVMRRVVERVRCTQVAIRSLSEDEARAIPSLHTTVFYDVNMRAETPASRGSEEAPQRGPLVGGPADPRHGDTWPRHASREDERAGPREKPRHEDWMDRVVASLADTVYLTIDCDGFDPAIMPAVGTPEPGGLSWYEGLTLIRKVFESRRVVACDLVELSPIPGLVAPNFL